MATRLTAIAPRFLSLALMTLMTPSNSGSSAQTTCADDPEYIHSATGFSCESWRGENCLDGVLLFEGNGDSQSTPFPASQHEIFARIASPKLEAVCVGGGGGWMAVRARGRAFNGACGRASGCGW